MSLLSRVQAAQQCQVVRVLDDGTVETCELERVDGALCCRVHLPELLANGLDRREDRYEARLPEWRRRAQERPHGLARALDRSA